VLISVNPFKNINNLYSASAVSKHKGRYLYELPPHVFALAEQAYRSLMTEREDQCVIISGESGAGKTEASKKIMQYIAAVSGSGSEIERVKDQILKSNPVLEAFGNAKTVRNNNSSRFGKYMEIFFDLQGDPVGGRITNYLLEKSRVVQPGAGERSFHIFYQLHAGLSVDEKKSYHLLPPSEYNYLKQSNCFSVNQMDDAEEYELTIEGMSALGISDELIAQIFRVVSGVLQLGQIEFAGSGDRSTVSTPEALATAAKLFGCTASTLESAMTSRTLKSGASELVQSWLDKDKAYYTRDALAKLMYSRLFDWVVNSINQAIDIGNIAEINYNDTDTIGVLDIYGFEIFGMNSFEQYCINFVNEKLQQIFIEKTLKSEQDEYLRENIQWVPVDYFNNKIVCDLIESRPKGIQAYLDEECLLGRGTDQTFIEKIKKVFSDHRHFGVPDELKTDRMDFIISHYAGEVRYSARNFLDKNKDYVWRDLLLVGESSSMDLMRSIFPAGDADRMGRARPVTAGTQFVRQVNLLMETLAQSHPHYIRCIKPNEAKKSALFDDQLVLHQVKYLGLLENVRVRRAGFAFRQTYDRFLRRYKMLSQETWPFWNGPTEQGCELVLQGMGMTAGTQYQRGTTKIFIRQPVSLFTLEELRDRKLHDIATLIQKVFRAWRARKFFLELREKSLGVFGRHKLRRRISVRRYYIGDYLNASDNIKVRSILSKHGDQRVVFMDEVDKINRKYKTQSRVLMLTDQAVYNLGHGNFSLKRRIPIADITAVSLSPKADSFIVLHVPSSYDYVYVCERKTEFLTALVDLHRDCTGHELKLTFTDSIEYHEGSGFFTKKREETPRFVRFVDNKEIENVSYHVDPANPKTQLIVEVGKIDTVNESVLQGLAPVKMTKGAKKPTRPLVAATASDQKHTLAVPTAASRYTPSSKSPSSPRSTPDIWVIALYDFQGQEVQELSFNQGDYIRILAMEPDGWWSAELNGKLGYVPKTYVQRAQKPGRNSRANSRALPTPGRM
jgi:myosin I